MQFRWGRLHFWTSAGNYLEGTVGLELMTQRPRRMNLTYTLVTVSEEAVARDVGTMRLGLYKSALGSTADVCSYLDGKLVCFCTVALVSSGYV